MLCKQKQWLKPEHNTETENTAIKKKENLYVQHLGHKPIIKTPIK